MEMDNPKIKRIGDKRMILSEFEISLIMVFLNVMLLFFIMRSLHRQETKK